MKKILIVNVNWVGDVIFSTPFIRAVKKNYPESFLACLVVPRCVEILKNNIYLDKIILNDEKFTHKGFKGKIKLALELRKYKFDTVYLLHRSLTRTLICVFAGIKQRAGYYTKKRGFLLTSPVKKPEKDMHRAETFLYIASYLGLKTYGVDYDFFISDVVLCKTKQMLDKMGLKRYAVINPGGNWLPKRWPYYKFASLADKITQKYKIPVIITGAEKDIELAFKIDKLMKTRAYIFAGKTNLEQLGALFKLSEVVISSDSGPLHIARAVGASVVGLYGPTSPDITGFIGKGKYKTVSSSLEGCKIPCYDKNCRDYKCMESIKTDEVLKVCEEFL